MPQENTALQTQNTGGLLGSLGNFVNTLATPAANLYTLKLQGDVLKQQSATNLATVQGNATTATAAATTATANADVKKWAIWGGIALAVVVVIALLMRRR